MIGQTRDSLGRMRSWMIATLLLAACGPTVANGDGSGGGGGSDEGSSASDDGGTGQDAPPQPDTIIDQSGAEFRWVCPPGEQCRIEIIDGVSPLPPVEEDGYAGPCPDDWFYTFGDDFDDTMRFFLVQGACPFGNGVAYGPENGRYAVCEQDADCPQVIDPASGGVAIAYTCVAGFCQDAVNFNVDELPARRTMVFICNGDTPRFGPPYPDFNAFDAACPDSDAPCDYVPDGCHYPRD